MHIMHIAMEIECVYGSFVHYTLTIALTLASFSFVIEHGANLYSVLIRKRKYEKKKSTAATHTQVSLENTDCTSSFILSFSIFKNIFYAYVNN